MSTSFNLTRAGLLALGLLASTALVPPAAAQGSGQPQRPAQISAPNFGENPRIMAMIPAAVYAAVE